MLHYVYIYSNTKTCSVGVTVSHDRPTVCAPPWIPSASKEKELSPLTTATLVFTFHSLCWRLCILLHLWYHQRNLDVGTHAKGESEVAQHTSVTLCWFCSVENWSTADWSRLKMPLKMSGWNRILSGTKLCFRLWLLYNLVLCNDYQKFLVFWCFFLNAGCLLSLWEGKERWKGKGGQSSISTCSNHGSGQRQAPFFVWTRCFEPR